MKLDNTRSLNLPYRAYTYKVLHQFSNTGNSPPPLLHLPGHNIDKKNMQILCNLIPAPSIHYQDWHTPETTRIKSVH
jgi:hypothetical protein